MTYLLHAGCSSPHLTFLFLHGLEKATMRLKSRSKKVQVVEAYQHPRRLRRLGSGAPGCLIRGISRKPRTYLGYVADDVQ